MPDKLYISVLNFKCNTLSEAGQELQKYLDLGINPILTDTDILVSVSDYSGTLQYPTEELDVLSVHDEDGREIRGWYVELEKRTDGIIQGKLTGRGIGCLRFVGNPHRFLSSGIISNDNRSREMILRMSVRLGILE